MFIKPRVINSQLYNNNNNDNVENNNNSNNIIRIDKNELVNLTANRDINEVETNMYRYYYMKSTSKANLEAEQIHMNTRNRLQEKELKLKEFQNKVKSRVRQHNREKLYYEHQRKKKLADSINNLLEKNEKFIVKAQHSQNMNNQPLTQLDLQNIDIHNNLVRARKKLAEAKTTNSENVNYIFASSSSVTDINSTTNNLTKTTTTTTKKNKHDQPLWQRGLPPNMKMNDDETRKILVALRKMEMDQERKFSIEMRHKNNNKTKNNLHHPKMIRKSKTQEIILLQQKIKDELKKKGIRQDPKFCTCGRSVMDANIALCEKSCIFYKNSSAYQNALTSALDSLEMSS